MKRIVALLVTVMAVLTATPTTAAAAGSGLDQHVSADEAVASERVERGAGHLDIGARWDGARWQLMLRDDTAATPVWRDPADVVMRVNDKSIMEFPGNKEYEFLHIPAGQRVHVIPQTQAPGVVWLGWNTQHPSVVERVDQRAGLVLRGTEGPGTLHVFLNNGFGAPEPLYDSTSAKEQRVSMELNTHVHANWIFDRPGAYAVHVSFDAKDTTGAPIRADSVLRFAVGDTTPVADAYALGRATPSAGPTAGESAAPAASSPDGTAARGGVSRVWIWAVAGALVAVAVAAVLIRNARRTRRDRQLAREESHD